LELQVEQATPRSFDEQPEQPENLDQNVAPQVDATQVDSRDDIVSWLVMVLGFSRSHMTSIAAWVTAAALAQDFSGPVDPANSKGHGHGIASIWE